MAQGTATYKASELASKAYQVFGTTPEVVAVALKTAGKKTATVDDAKKIVKEFLEREVK